MKLSEADDWARLLDMLVERGCTSVTISTRAAVGGGIELAGLTLTMQHDASVDEAALMLRPRPPSPTSETTHAEIRRPAGLGMLLPGGVR